MARRSTTRENAAVRNRKQRAHANQLRKRAKLHALLVRDGAQRKIRRSLERNRSQAQASRRRSAAAKRKAVRAAGGARRRAARITGRGPG